jgi:O-methyltransferase
MTTFTNPSVRREPAPGELDAWAERIQLAPLLEKIKPFTMVPDAPLVDLACLVQAVLAEGIPGNIVECGAWRGGASFLMADLLRQAGVKDRKVWMFDSFEGLPAPQEIDGSAALEYAQNTDSPEYYDNCRASFEDVQRQAEKLGLTPYVRCVKGWFEETLPAHRAEIGPIAILRIDGNWYASVRCCLDTLYDQVVDDGFVLFHTYYTYDGCALAVHDFLGERHLAHRMEPVVGPREGGPEDYQSALLRKGQPTWKWLRQAYLAGQEIETLVPPGEAFILVDQQALGLTFRSGCRALPFVERDGEDWGEPEDDQSALEELERQRQAGARFLIFAWPAFWWLDYYEGLSRRLRSEFPCVLENERLVAFDLRP